MQYFKNKLFLISKVWLKFHGLLVVWHLQYYTVHSNCITRKFSTWPPPYWRQQLTAATKRKFLSTQQLTAATLRTFLDTQQLSAATSETFLDTQQLTAGSWRRFFVQKKLAAGKWRPYWEEEKQKTAGSWRPFCRQNSWQLEYFRNNSWQLCHGVHFEHITAGTECPPKHGSYM